VVDAYTRRILDRHCILPGKADYEEIRELFQRALEPAIRQQEFMLANGAPMLERLPWHCPSAIGNEHFCAHRAGAGLQRNAWLIVGVGKNYCKKSQPKCDDCPLQRFLPGVK